MKKNRSILFILFSILVNIFVFQRCNNSIDTDLKYFQKNPVDIMSQFTNINFSVCCNNEFDYIGEYHNLGLDKVIGKYSKLPKVKSTSENKDIIVGLVSEFLNEKPLFENLEICDSINRSFLYSIINIPQTKSIKKLVFSNEKQQDYYDKVNNIISKGDADTLQELIDNINKVEKDVLDSDLSDLEKSQLLISTSVAKYSSVFWSEYFMKTTPMVRTKSFSSEDDALAWWKRNVIPNASKIVESDFRGAAEGAAGGLVFGGIITSPTGPGAIGGAVSGALAGGAVGSIVSSSISGVELIFTLF